MAKQQASDLHLKPIGHRCCAFAASWCRSRAIRSKAGRSGEDAPAAAEPRTRRKSSRRCSRSTSATALPGVARFRANVYICSAAPSRRLPPHPHQPADDRSARSPRRHPAISPRFRTAWCSSPGPTGSGKSTTLAAMISHITETRAAAHRHHRRPTMISPGPWRPWRCAGLAEVARVRAHFRAGRWPPHLVDEEESMDRVFDGDDVQRLGFGDVPRSLPPASVDLPEPVGPVNEHQAVRKSG